MEAWTNYFLRTCHNKSRPVFGPAWCFNGGSVEWQVVVVLFPKSSCKGNGVKTIAEMHNLFFIIEFPDH